MSKLAEKYPSYFVYLPSCYSLADVARAFNVDEGAYAGLFFLATTHNHGRLFMRRGVDAALIGKANMAELAYISADLSKAGLHDIYQIMREMRVAHDPEIAHAFKKYLRCGKGSKSKEQDLQEARESLERWIELFDAGIV